MKEFDVQSLLAHTEAGLEDLLLVQAHNILLLF